jgi:hypothetical protein
MLGDWTSFRESQTISQCIPFVSHLGFTHGAQGSESSSGEETFFGVWRCNEHPVPDLIVSRVLFSPIVNLFRA